MDSVPTVQITELQDPNDTHPTRSPSYQHRHPVNDRQQTIIFIFIVFDIYSLDFYFNVYLLYVAYVNYIIKRIWYGMVWWCLYMTVT